jgi:hypothetical protein
MKSGDIVMKKLRWSYGSLRIGLVIKQLEDNLWEILWTMDGIFSLEKCHGDGLVVINEDNVKEAEARWRITAY